MPQLGYFPITTTTTTTSTIHTTGIATPINEYTIPRELSTILTLVNLNTKESRNALA